MRKREIEAVVHVAQGFAQADAWDRAQLATLTLDERLRIAEELRRRAYGESAPDVRASERGSPRRVHETIEGPGAPPVPLAVIGLADLIQNKRAAARHKDLDDVEHLEPLLVGR